MFKYCLIDTRQCLSNQWIILTGLTYIISSIPDVIFFSSYRGSIADFIILSFSNQYYFLLIILPLLFLFLLKIDWLPSSTILLRNASITTYVIARFSALVISLSAIITFHLSLAAIMAVGSSMVKSTSSYTSSYYNSTISLFKEHFVSSSASICWIIVNYLFGLLLIASIIWLIIVSTPRKFRVPLIVLLYFFIFLGVQRSSSWYHPALFIFNMIILSNALPYNLFPWSMLIFLLTTGLILFLLCKRWWTIYRC